MVRRRGGGTGGNGQEKRQATTPVGGTYKDARRNIQGDEEYDEEEEWTQVIRNRPKSPPKQSGSGSVPDMRNQPDPIEQQNEPTSRPSFASVLGQGQTMQSRRDSTASNAVLREKKTLDRIFTTPAPEGSMRDDIVVEVQTINEKPFKGSLTFTEAKEVFTLCMGLEISIIHGIRFAFSTYPVVKFKLKEQIDVDKNLQHVEHFNYERRYTVNGIEKSDILGCRIKGLRLSNQAGNGHIDETDQDPNIRWVKIEWVDYAIEEKRILDWLNYFGEQAGELSEDIHPNSDSDADPIGSGTFSIKMRLRKDIPQLLPMWGKRIRIYHRGVQKLCSNCFGTHLRRNCRSEKIRWTRYVLNFMEKNPEIPPELYGRWWKVVNDEFGEIVEENEQEIQQDSQAEPQNQTQGQSWPSEPTHNQASKIANQRKPVLSRTEEENLSDYLQLGMSIKDAREAFQRELEAAELKLRIRENKRAHTRGSVQNLPKTSIGPTTSTRGTGRGGLSFN